MKSKKQDFQLKSLLAAKKYLHSNYKKGVNIEVSPFCDFITWADCLGKEKLSLISNKKSLSMNLIYLYLKEIFYIKNNYSVFKNFKYINSKKKN